MENPQKFEWKEFEHNTPKKSTDWFWYIGSGALIVVIVSIFLKNFLFAVFAIVAVFVIFALYTQTPQETDFKIDAKGIKIGKTFYKYKEIDSFWINYNPPHKKELILELDKRLHPHVKIPIGNQDPNEIRDFLSKILEEEEYEESLIETIAERLGF